MAQDKKFSVIVPIYRDGWKDLPSLLFHLREQDYANWELVTAYNSPDSDTQEKTRKTLKKEKQKSYLEVDAGYDPDLKAGNHCAAFNAGAERATGDFLLFLDPDIELFPGVLREYKDAFDANPEVSFVYGDYDLKGGLGRILGRRYDEYELRCANYVSGAFPIRREAFKGWDPSVKSLQDWDMWLSAVDGGATGLYIGRPCFQADAPKDGGISSEGAANWEERYSYVRTKHGFPPSKTVYTSLGAPAHATNAAKVVGADSRVLSNLHTFKPNSYENVVLIGFYSASPDPSDPMMAVRQHVSLFYKGGNLKSEPVPGKKVIHWVGTDIFMLQHKVSWMGERFISKMLTAPDLGVIHLAECEETQRELQELGIESQVVPLPPKRLFEPLPLPEEFAVGIYVNPTQDMYFEDLMYELADAMPDVKFRFFGDRHPKMEGNKEWVGFVDMGEFLKTVSAVVRITVHDGLPLGPVEAMMAGRQVIATHPLKYAVTHEKKNGEPDLATLIEQVRALQSSSLDPEAPSYWKRTLSHEAYREAMDRILS